MCRHSCQPRIRSQVLVQSNAGRQSAVLIGVGGCFRLGFDDLGGFADKGSSGCVGDRLHQCGAASD